MKSPDQMAADLRRAGYAVDSMDEGEIRRAYLRMDDDDHEKLRLERQGRLDTSSASETWPDEPI